MIVVDTSVWIAAFRNRQGTVAAHLRVLLDADEVGLAAPVRVEILAGASHADRPRLRRTLSALPVFYPSEATWLRIESWLDTISTSGDWFGMGDLLIAGIAAERSTAVWSLDQDFARMARLKLVEFHRAA